MTVKEKDRKWSSANASSLSFPYTVKYIEGVKHLLPENATS